MKKKTIRNIKFRAFCSVAVLFLHGMSAEVNASSESKLPNIVVILADDLGYGDVSFLNADSKIQTPRMDALAKEGVWATDAHAPSAICSPSRYAMLTGRYAWRGSMKTGRLNPWDPPAIKKEDFTLGDMLNTKGYQTACIGKWHLGFVWPWEGGEMPPRDLIGTGVSIAKNEMFDWTQPISEGPLTAGFDDYFGVDCPNFPPYGFIENDKLMCAPVWIDKNSLKSFGVRGFIHGSGPGEEGWDIARILPTITARAVNYIHEQSKSDQPYFLYFSLTSPHTPVDPTKEFRGKSDAGSYGDWVVQTDEAIGQVIDAIKASGDFENTLIIVSSDNGPEGFTRELIQSHEHRPTAHLRGIKGDAWEGGHRVPFIASWPNGGIAGGRKMDATISLMDLFATTASIVEFELEEGVAEDSLNILPSLLQDEVVRDEMIYHSGRSAYGIRQGDWVYLRKGGSKEEPDWYVQAQQIKSAAASDELFNLADDEAQRHNISSNHPERVALMKARILEIEKSASTR